MAKKNALIDLQPVGDQGGPGGVFQPRPSAVQLTPDQVGDMLAAAFEVLTDIRFHTAVGDGDTRALFFHARAGREEVEEAQLLRLDADGLIRELTLFGRPLPALTTVMRDLGPRLLRRQGHPGLARFVALATRPLAAMTGSGDRRIVPLGDPARARRPGR